MGTGKRPTEVAEALHVTASAVTYHLKHIMPALGVATEGELLRLAVLLATQEPSPVDPATTP